MPGPLLINIILVLLSIIITTAVCYLVYKAKIRKLNLNSDKADIQNCILELNAALSGMGHFLANSISSISTTGQLAQIDRSYMEKFLDTTMIQVQKLIDLLNSFNKFRGNLREKVKEFETGNENLKSIIEEIEIFKNTFQKKSPTDASSQKKPFHTDDK